MNESSYGMIEHWEKKNKFVHEIIERSEKKTHNNRVCDQEKNNHIAPTLE